MKKLAAVLLVTVLLACASPKVIDGKMYDTYGPLNEQKKSEDITYAPSFWSILWSVAFFQSIAAPVYFLGFDLFEPVKKKEKND